MSIDDEIMLDAEDTRRETAYIREQLPIDDKDTLSNELMAWILDTIACYYYESGILESNDDEVDIDMTEVADYVCRHAESEKQITLDAQLIRLVAEADLDFQELAL